eukprot:384072-Rhodomonas_salina.1
MQPASPRRRAGVGLALEQATPGTLCYVADIQPGGRCAFFVVEDATHCCARSKRAGGWNAEWQEKWCLTGLLLRQCGDARRRADR